MPLRKDIQSVLVIGSGPIIIGQAAEFDYSGTQACKALKEKGMQVILVNSNPATIMTDNNVADKVYIEPITVEYVTKIITKEQPDGLLPTLGGQTGLNMAVELAEKGVLKKWGVKLLGTDLEAIEKGEDRFQFRKLLQDLGEPLIESEIITEYEQVVDFVDKNGLPIVVRPAYTMGGSGGGIAKTEAELKDIVETGLKRSRINQVLIEKSVTGWKEIEYEVIRDKADNCITVCNMENIDPVGIHTGDSIVVAPSQTLTDKEYHLLRNVSLKIIRALNIEGGCNIQFALNPESREYYIIEVNPRVSRSSALASKAAGYPIARVSAQIALGLHLDEIKNPITGKTFACFEPALDYVVCKIPRWPFDKFKKGDRDLGTQMKATGEVMAIGRNFNESFLKALASLDLKLPTIEKEFAHSQIKDEILQKEDGRIFAVLQALYNNISPEEIHDWTAIDLFYLYKLQNITEMIKELEVGKGQLNRLILKAKNHGFSDKMIGKLVNKSEQEIRGLRLKAGCEAVFKMVDTCASEFSAETPYYYSTYESEDEVELNKGNKVLVVGSGPIRIGQGIEFDYCSVHAVNALKKQGTEAIIVNNNPETVSTDFDTGDKLYFEPLTAEYVLNIIKRENVKDVILQFGGQTSLALAEPLIKEGINVLSTDLSGLNLAEDREQFNSLFAGTDITVPAGDTACNIEQALKITDDLGYPVLVRPSFVLGGRGMEIVYNNRELKLYLQEAIKISPDYPVLIDRFIEGKEVEVDAITDGSEILIPGIMEHIDRAGVHSGDSMAIYPAQSLNKNIRKMLVEHTEHIARKLKTRGLINIQFVIDDKDNIYVIEVNPRASRTVPILSKVTGVPMIDYAVRIMLGENLADITDARGLMPPSKLVSIKIPVFSFDKLPGVDVYLNPEMKSTGEVLGTDINLKKAVYKGLKALDFEISPGKKVLFSLAERNYVEGFKLAEKIKEQGYIILATIYTADYFKERGLKVDLITAPIQSLKSGDIDMIINTPDITAKSRNTDIDGFNLRRKAVEYGIPCYTSLGSVEVIFDSIHKIEDTDVYSLDDYYKI